MIIKIINKIKKNILIINIIIFFIGALFYYLNQNKFDTYKNYIEYSFQERLIFTNESGSDFFNSGKIKFFLNDLDFNKKFYGITDSGIKNSPNKININIDHVKNKIEFTFNSKKKITSIFNGNIGTKDTENKNDKIINNFIEESLNKFHNKLFSNLKDEINQKENQLKKLIAIKSNLLDDNNIIVLQILNKQQTIMELHKFLDLKNNKLIIINNYSKKFRRLHLNSEEYVLSILILLLLFNFLIKNLNKILK